MSIELKEMGRRFQGAVRGLVQPVLPQQGKLTIISSRELLEMRSEHEWLVPRLLVKGQPGVIGGAKKSLKTSLAIDLVVSLGTGSCFLGQPDFAVRSPQPVLMLTRESGEATIRETFWRICRSRQIKWPKRARVDWSFNLPSLGVDEDLEEFGQRIGDGQYKLVVLDPLYLCLLTGRQDLNPASLYDVGPLLAQATQACLKAGATPLFVHHTRKQQRQHRYQQPELDDLSFAGVQEFARQWLLVGRREEYVPGSGDHRLWLNVGGSAGHSGSWAVDVREGQLGDDFQGRTWQVEVRTEAVERTMMQARKSDERKRGGQERFGQDVDAVHDFLGENPEGETQRGIITGVGFSKARVQKAVQTLLREKRIEQATVMKRGGRAGAQGYDGYRLVRGQERRGEKKVGNARQ